MTNTRSVPVELLQDLRDLAYDAVEHHRQAFAGYKHERQARMDCVIRSADELLAQPATDCGLEIRATEANYLRDGGIEYYDLIRKSDADARDAMRLERIAELESALLDASAERNAVQRERDQYKSLLGRECDDSDAIFLELGMPADEIRTGGGFLMIDRVVSSIKNTLGQLQAELAALKAQEPDYYAVTSPISCSLQKEYPKWAENDTSLTITKLYAAPVQQVSVQDGFECYRLAYKFCEQRLIGGDSPLRSAAIDAFASGYCFGLAAAPAAPAADAGLVEALETAVDYLNSNALSSIASGSTCHRKMRAALATYHAAQEGK